MSWTVTKKTSLENSTLDYLIFASGTVRDVDRYVSKGYASTFCDSRYYAKATKKVNHTHLSRTSSKNISACVYVCVSVSVHMPACGCAHFCTHVY